ncbi:PQQ-binding-like beta-propeller repeat protein [Thermodesulfobacteriota bacterium]
MAAESKLKPLSIPRNRENDGWLVCPKCGSGYATPTHFCKKCRYYAPSWTPSDVKKARPRWIFRLIFGLICCVWFLFLCCLAWLCRAYIPNPLLFFHQPASQISAISHKGEWVGYARDPAHTRYLDYASPLKGRIRWSLFLGKPTSSAPAVKDGILFVGGDYKIHALEAETGRAVWEIPTTGPVHSSPAIAGGSVFFGLLDERIIALDRFNGDLRWEFKAPNWVFGSPTVQKGMLYIGSGDGAIHAIDAKTGQPVWRIQTEGHILSAPALKDGILYATSNDRKLYSVSARTGALRLCFQISLNIFEAPVVANNLVYFTAEDGHLYTLRHRAREFPGQHTMLRAWLQLWLWRFPIPPPVQPGAKWRFSPKIPGNGFVSSPAVTREVLYIGDQLGWLYACDSLKGDALWEFKAQSAILTSPLVLGEEVYFGSKDGDFYALDRHKGEFLWKVSLGAPIEVSPVFAVGLLFVRTEDGSLYAIE